MIDAFMHSFVDGLKSLQKEGSEGRWGSGLGVLEPLGLHFGVRGGAKSLQNDGSVGHLVP